MSFSIDLTKSVTVAAVLKEFKGTTVTSAVLCAVTGISDGKILRRRLRKYFAAERDAEIAAGADRVFHRYNYSVSESEAGKEAAEDVAGILNYLRLAPQGGSSTVPTKRSKS